MALVDKLEGARNGLAMSFAYMNLVGEEMGMEKAIALSGKADGVMGDAQGRILREQQGGKDVDINAATTMALDAIKDGFGIISEVIESSPERMVVRCSRCPVYEAAESVGIDTGTIETLCRTGSLKFMDAMVKQFNPKLSYRLRKFRSGPDDCCEEEIVLG